MSIARILEDEGRWRPPTELLPDAKGPLLDAERHWLIPRFMDEAGNFLTTIQSYVVRTGHHTILVDACVGNDKERRLAAFSRLQGPWLRNLVAAGVDPGKVDYVMCTHLHFDHVGWNTRLVNGRWEPTFPNARYLFARSELEHWQREFAAGRDRDGAIADSVLPILEAGKATVVEDTHALDDQVWLEPTPGHTPGHVCVHVRGRRGREAIFTGDLMHHPVQCARPEWDVRASVDPRQSSATRRGFLERNADSGRRILAAHFAAPNGGTIKTAGDTWRFAAELS